MKRVKLLTFFLFCSFYLPVEAHSGKARFHIIIDTDGAADDLRAICMLLGSLEVETLAITSCEGALTPVGATQKVTALLHHFYNEEIPVGTGRALNIAPPAWRGQSEQISWGDAKDIAPIGITATDLIIQTLEETDDKIIIFCFGTLTNLNDVLMSKSELKEKIDRVIWYNSSANPLRGVNYEADPASAHSILASGIRVDIVSGEDKHEIVIDGAYLDMISSVGNIYSKKIVETHSTGVLKSVVEARHLKMFDDLAVVYLFAPELFTSAGINKTSVINSLTDADSAKRAKEIAVEVLSANKPN